MYQIWAYPCNQFEFIFIIEKGWIWQYKGGDKYDQILANPIPQRVGKLAYQSREKVECTNNYVTRLNQLSL